MADITTKTQAIDRNELDRFLPPKSFRLVKFFENLADDVGQTIPAAIERTVQGPGGGSVDDNVVVFNGTTGFSVKDSGVSIDDLAPLESPAFTGVPTAPTAAPGTSTGQLATTAFVAGETGVFVEGPAISVDSAIPLFDGATGKLIKDSGTLLTSLAPLASPALTGNPTAPTAAAADNDTTIATTAFVQNAVTTLTTAAAVFSVHNNGVAQSIPNATFTKLTFSTEVFDVGGKFATSTWTPPAGRPVMLTGAVTLPTTDTTLTVVAVYKNGAIFKNGSQLVNGAASNAVAVVTCIDIPNGTDTYELWCFQNTGGAQNTIGTASLTYFQGTTIGS